MNIDSKLLDSFRKSYRQRCEVAEEKKKRVEDFKYEAFKKRLNANRGDLFNNRDLVYYFREMSEGKYYIANYAKDMHIFKRLRQSFSVEDIILMIDFLFSPANDYLPTPTVNLMASSWVNTIHTDAIAWADGKYIPHSQRGKRKNQISSREYKESGNEDVVIGEWEE